MLSRPYKCHECNKRFRAYESRAQHIRDAHGKKLSITTATDPDWNGKRMNCGQSPIVPVTQLCGPCTWGEAETVGGNW